MVIEESSNFPGTPKAASHLLVKHSHSRSICMGLMGQAPHGLAAGMYLQNGTNEIRLLKRALKAGKMAREFSLPAPGLEGGDG